MEVQPFLETPFENKACYDAQKLSLSYYRPENEPTEHYLSKRIAFSYQLSYAS